MEISASPRESCALFRDLSDGDYRRALEFFSAKELTVKKGTILKESDSAPDFFGFVISGSVQVYMDDINGKRMVMSTVGPGQTFGESMCYLGKSSFVYIQATADTSLLTMRADRVCRNSGIKDDTLAMQLSARFTAMLARRTLDMNRRIQVLSKLTIREKILTFLSEECGESGGREILISMNREDLAAYLGTNVSALSRELGNMKKEGILDFRKNMFRIL